MGNADLSPKEPTEKSNGGMGREKTKDPCQKHVKNENKAIAQTEGQADIPQPDPIINFYPYQQKWIKDNSRFKIGMFARQTGKTFTTCAEIVKDCLEAEAKGNRVRWVILSRGERQAREAMEEAIKPLIKAYTIIYKDVSPEYSEELIAGWSALEVRFTHGSRITALPANPDTARGFSANVFLDEFAFHQDSRKIWQALFPVISKPGLKLRIASTPNGKGNKFYELMSMVPCIIGGRTAKPTPSAFPANFGLLPPARARGLAERAGASPTIWSHHITDIHQAIADGLPRNAEELQEAAGDEDLWKQEYLLEWLDEASSWLSYDLISGCENPQAGKPELYDKHPIYIGNDIAARNDLWVAAVFEDVQGVLWLRELVAKKRISFAEQDFIMDGLVSKYNPVRIAVDQTGMGEKPVEDMKRRYGSIRVEGVIFTAGRKLDMASALKERFEDRTIRIPAGDRKLRADLHSIKKITGLTGTPRLLDDGTGDGHADRFWAFALVAGAASHPVSKIEWTSLGPRPSTRLREEYYNG